MDLEFYKIQRPYREIRAVYNDETVRVYQAFSKEIALPALDAQTFVPPFKTEGIVSWIKPSFLWCLKRTQWGKFTRISKKNTKGENENNALVLGIDIRREFFDRILSVALVTHFEEYPEIDKNNWKKIYQKAQVRVQWDPEKTIEGIPRPFKSIQIGLSGNTLIEYSQNICRIINMKTLIEEIESTEIYDEKISLLPDEIPYPVSEEVLKRLNMIKKEKTIYFFTKNQPYYEFSNYAPFGIEMQGAWWPTVEHYYQAMKFEDISHIETIRKATSPKEAKNLGRTENIEIKENWDAIKYDIMYGAVLKKFQTYSKLKDLLLDSGDAEIVENSPFDYYWGTGEDGSGQNMLGKILMSIREIL